MKTGNDSIPSFPRDFSGNLCELKLDNEIRPCISPFGPAELLNIAPAIFSGQKIAGMTIYELTV